jgi:hypothetical protein
LAVPLGSSRVLEILTVCRYKKLEILETKTDYQY